jgi:hypothetical protein
VIADLSLAGNTTWSWTVATKEFEGKRKFLVVFGLFPLPGALQVLESGQQV